MRFSFCRSSFADTQAIDTAREHIVEDHEIVWLIKGESQTFVSSMYHINSERPML